MRYDFSVTNIDGGIHYGKTGSGYFTFDNEGVGGSGEFVKQVSEFNFNWLGQNYGIEALDFENDGDGVLLVDGVFQGLDWDYIASADLSWDLTTDEFDYVDTSAIFPLFQGSGEVIYQQQQATSAVPEPGVLVGLGVVSLGGLLNKKKKLFHC
ncbi:MAG: PEP-CTERM sorting domain-containing protein [Okeania sp. SIO2D1]|nr:PEP-CTERM sorting domain-containing protein [Okeania sp. SIO2D1]